MSVSWRCFQLTTLPILLFSLDAVSVENTAACVVPVAEAPLAEETAGAGEMASVLRAALVGSTPRHPQTREQFPSCKKLRGSCRNKGTSEASCARGLALACIDEVARSQFTGENFKKIAKTLRCLGGCETGQKWNPNQWTFTYKKKGRLRVGEDDIEAPHSRGAHGLFQFMPGTFKGVWSSLPERCRNNTAILDPVCNTLATIVKLTAGRGAEWECWGRTKYPENGDRCGRFFH